MPSNAPSGTDARPAILAQANSEWAFPAYRAPATSGEAQGALVDADAAETAVQMRKADLVRRREGAVADLADAHARVDAAAVAMAAGAMGDKGKTIYRQAVQRAAELQALLTAINDRLIPQAEADLAISSKALDAARRGLTRARLQQLAIEALIPADRRVFELWGELGAALKASDDARLNIWGVPLASEFFGDDKLDALGALLLARFIPARVSELLRSMPPNGMTPLGDPGQFHAATFGLVEAAAGSENAIVKGPAGVGKKRERP